MQGEANFTYDGTDLAVTCDTATFTSANANDPLIVIKNTTNDASGPILKFVKDKGAAGAANDVNGIIQFFGDDANQDNIYEVEIEYINTADGEPEVPISVTQTNIQVPEGGKKAIELQAKPALPTDDTDGDGIFDIYDNRNFCSSDNNYSFYCFHGTCIKKNLN